MTSIVACLRRYGASGSTTIHYSRPDPFHWLLASQCMRATPVRAICSSRIIPDLGRQRIDGGPTPRRASFVSETRRAWDASTDDALMTEQCVLRSQQFYDFSRTLCWGTRGAPLPACPAVLCSEKPFSLRLARFLQTVVAPSSGRYTRLLRFP